MEIVLYVLAAIAVLILLLLGYAATKPNQFRVQRSATIQAPAEKIFPLINDFHAWTSWSPWEKLDPDLKRTHSGASAGPGAVYDWEGNKKVGKGRMEIKESTPSSRILIQLDFFKPFEAHNITEFTLVPQGGATQVNWTMDGSQPFMFKVMSIFMNLDKMIGKDFETGLANLKANTER